MHAALTLAFVASISVGFSAPLKHFSLFGGIKIGGEGGGVGGGRKEHACPQTPRF